MKMHFEVGEDVGIYNNDLSEIRLKGRITHISHDRLAELDVIESFDKWHEPGDMTTVPIDQLEHWDQSMSPIQPQTKEETMNEIDQHNVKLIREYFEKNGSWARSSDCATELKLDHDYVNSLIRQMVDTSPNIPSVTFLGDKNTPAIQDGLGVEKDPMGSKSIPTLAGAQCRGGISLPDLQDIKSDKAAAMKDHEEYRKWLESDEGKAWEANKFKPTPCLVAAEKLAAPVDLGVAPSTEADKAWAKHVDNFLKKEIEEARDADDDEGVSKGLFEIASILQQMATNYDYGTEEEFCEAQDWIMMHRRALKFLAVQADQIDGIIEEEEMEEAENE